MPLRLVAVAFEVLQTTDQAEFWGRLLGRTVVPESHGALVPGDDTQVGLRIVAGPASSSGADHLHLHLTSASAEEQQRTVETALGLGARHLDVGQLPDEGHVVLED